MYLTGDAEEQLCFVTLYIPDERFAKAALRGAIRELCFPHNWEEYNDLTPDEAADIFQTVFDSIIMCDEECSDMAPDYDSGWFEAALSSQNAKAHGLGATPTRFICLHNDQSDGSGHNVSVTGNYGYPDALRMTSEYVQVLTTTAYVVYNAHRQSGTGYFRYLVWL